MKVLTFGELLLRLSTPKGVRVNQAQQFDVHYGGGEANVAVSLSHFGHDAAFASALPGNPLGDAGIQRLNSFDVDTTHVYRKEGRMGAYFLETGSGSRGSQVTYDRAHSAFADLPTGGIDWVQAFEGVDWFHWSGISPAVSPAAAQITKEAVLYASTIPGLTISVDLNYREKLWKYGTRPNEVMPTLVSHCDVIIGNEGHNKIMLDIDPVNGLGKTDPADYEEACRRVMNKFPRASFVAMTMRDNVSASHNNLHAILMNSVMSVSSTYPITDIADRIGGGDAFTAGLIHGIASKWSGANSIEFAVAASVLKHTINGDFNLVTEQEVQQLIESNGTGHVSR